MGVLLSGNNEYLEGPNYSRAQSDHTVSYWLRLDNAAGTSRPFGCSGAWEARTNGSTGLLTSDYLQAGTLVTTTLTVGTYHHVAFVQNVSGAQKLAYLDGVLSNTVPPGTTTFAGIQSGPIRIGWTAGGGAGTTDQSWFGAIDDIRVYNRVMTANEIQTIYALRGQDGILDNIQHHWPMNEGGEGQAVNTVVDVIAGLNCTPAAGTPVYNYDAGITQLVR